VALQRFKGLDDMKKDKLKQQIESADSAKKVNALDLSSDQDLTIGLMNLLFIEDYVASGMLHDMVADVREKLMSRIIKKSDKNYGVSVKLLLESIRLIELGNKESGISAYDLYNQAYEYYSMFWGLNMGLIDAGDVEI
jgi:hypothetical protein